MTTTTADPRTTGTSPTDTERFDAILTAQRSAYLRDGAPTLEQRRRDLRAFGVGASGMGKYHGVEGFRTLSHPKGIYTQGRWNATTLLRAPYGRRADRLLGLFLR